MRHSRSRNKRFLRGSNRGFGRIALLFLLPRKSGSLLFLGFRGFFIDLDALEPTIFPKAMQRDSVAGRKCLPGILLDPFKSDEFAVQRRQLLWLDTIHLHQATSPSCSIIGSLLSVVRQERHEMGVFS